MAAPRPTRLLFYYTDSYPGLIDNWAEFDRTLSALTIEAPAGSIETDPLPEQGKPFAFYRVYYDKTYEDIPIQLQPKCDTKAQVMDIVIKTKEAQDFKSP